MSERTKSETNSILNEEEVVEVKRKLASSSRGATLKPDDIAVVKVEFSIPASRLFGSSLTLGGGSTEQLDSDVGAGGDPPHVPPQNLTGET
jgi:hypothetical protein